jgi:hypothetical protein
MQLPVWIEALPFALSRELENLVQYRYEAYVDYGKSRETTLTVYTSTVVAYDDGTGYGSKLEPATFRLRLVFSIALCLAARTSGSFAAALTCDSGTVSRNPK